MIQSEPKRVVYVHFVPGRGGSTTSLSTLIENLDRRRYEPIAVQAHTAIGEAGEQLRRAAGNLHHVPVPLVWNQSWFSESNLRGRAWRAFRPDPDALAFLRETAPDLVHVNDFPAVSFAAAAAALDIPIVWHSRLVLFHGKRLHPARRVLAEMERLADRIVCISETEALQFKRPDVRVIYNPIDLSKAAAASGTGASLRGEFGIGSDECVITAPVALTTMKGAWDFIPACGIAVRMAPEVKFRFFLVGDVPGTGRRHALPRWIGGPAGNLERARAMLASEGLTSRLTITGFRDDVFRYMDAADIVVFPGRMRACGRPCFEGAALGKPVLVTMPNKHTRVVLDGETGYVLPEAQPAALAEAMVRLARDPELARAMGARGLARVPSTFGAATQAAAMMDLYDECS